MSEWKEYKLEDLGFLQRGRSRHRPRYAFHLYGGKYPFVQTGEIREAKKYITKFEKTYSEEGLKQSKLWPKGTLCITIAANIAELAILSFDACFPDSVLGFIPDQDKVDLDFAYYTLVHFQKELKHIGEGSVQDNINLGTFQEVLFPIPPLEEQNAIAEILSSLDDKIDLLHRQNQTLEQMAETLFRQWFVEKESELIPLGDCIRTTSGGTPSRKKLEYYENGVYPWVKSKELNKGFVLDTEEKITEEALSKSSAKVLPESSVLIAMYGATVGEYAIIAQEATCNQAICACIPNEKFPYTFIYYTIKANVEELKNRAVGSAQQNISQVLIKSLEIAVNENIGHFHSEVEPMLKKIKLNHYQIQSLEKLRNTLLPKLMDGTIRVS